MSHRVEFRSLQPDDLQVLSARFSGGFNDFGPRDPEATPIEQHQLAVIDEAGALLGSVSWRPARYGPNRGSRAWNIGIELMPEARGKGYGSEAQRLLAAHLFATTDAHRVEAGTDVDNVAEQRALEKAGFKREGVLRGAQSRPDGRHDLAIYSVLREDL